MPKKSPLTWDTGKEFMMSPEEWERTKLAMFVTFGVLAIFFIGSKLPKKLLGIGKLD